MHRFLLALAAGTLIVAPLAAQTQYRYETYTLPNGLRVILSEDHSTAVVAVDIYYDVGSRNERVGRSGFAHLFEHMMFQGSEHVAKGEHLQLIERAGGSMNGTTNEDRTAYFETLPANRLNLGLWLEADRMRSLAVTDSTFENQRETVKEERRLSVDNRPYGKAFTDGLTLPYDSTACFAYAHTVIGSMTDLDAAQTKDVQQFFNLYYAPNNAVLAVVGDFQPAEAKSLIQQYFGTIKRNEATPPVTCTHQFNAGAKTRVFEDEHANLPAVIIAYRIPRHVDLATYPLTLLSSPLGEGESSRLNIAMVRDSKSALQAASGVDSRRGPSLFLVFAIANQGVSPDTLAAQLRAQVAKVAKVAGEGITQEELDKAKNSLKAGQIFGRQTPMGLANSLLHFALYHDSLSEIDTDIDRYMAVTREDVRRAAAKYLIPENSTTIVVVPKPAADAEGGSR